MRNLVVKVINTTFCDSVQNIRNKWLAVICDTSSPFALNILTMKLLSFDSLNEAIAKQTSVIIPKIRLPTGPEYGQHSTLVYWSNGKLQFLYKETSLNSKYIGYFNSILF
jgi:hypothetical protein